MSKHCPPGVICIENITIIFFIVVSAIVGGYFYLNRQISPIILQKEIIMSPELSPRFTSSYSTRPDDVLLNPYTAPRRVNSFFPTTGDPRGIPINIKTRGFNTNYTQTGILTRDQGKETILPLMGRSLHTNRNKWQYYTMSDKNNSVKLPVSKNGRSATQEYGVDELFNGDTVYVEGYNDSFRVTIYDNNLPQYIPVV
jgi:hypothetical protein